MGYKKINETLFENTYILWLASDVLVVARVNKKMRGEDTPEWAAYIGAVKHETEYERVAKSGKKLPRNIADLLFPFSKTHTWRF